MTKTDETTAELGTIRDRLEDVSYATHFDRQRLCSLMRGQGLRDRRCPGRAGCPCASWPTQGELDSLAPRPRQVASKILKSIEADQAHMARLKSLILESGLTGLAGPTELLTRDEADR